MGALTEGREWCVQPEVQTRPGETSHPQAQKTETGRGTTGRRESWMMKDSPWELSVIRPAIKTASRSRLRHLSFHLQLLISSACVSISHKKTNKEWPSRSFSGLGIAPQMFHKYPRSSRFPPLPPRLNVDILPAVGIVYAARLQRPRLIQAVFIQ